MEIARFRSVLIAGALTAIFSGAVAQDEDTPKQPPHSNIDPEDFSAATLEELVLIRINAFRREKGLDTLVIQEVAQKASKDQSAFMAKEGQAFIEGGGGKKKDTGSRVAYFGGSKNAREVVIKVNASKGRDPYTYNDVAGQVAEKWTGGKNELAVLSDPAAVYTGVGAAIDADGKRIYISQVVGGFDMLNEGAGKMSELDHPYTKKKYGLRKPSEPKLCKPCEKFADLENLQKALLVEGRSIYFDYPDLKSFRRLIRNAKDGLGVDIIQRDQYPCGKAYNVYDNNYLNRGIMLKRMYSKKIFKKNEIKDRKENRIRFRLAELPDNFDSPDYELNLLVIIEKNVCRSITRKYLADGGMESSTPLGLLPDTVYVAGDGRYRLAADQAVLNFRIPFEKSKYEYRPEDIRTFLKSLDEPDFIVREVEIFAYSSIEGDTARNAKLQQKRAESIVAAMERLQKGSIRRNIVTSDSWEEFRRQVKGTPNEGLSAKSKEEVQKELAANRTLLKELEPILQQQRYAQIILHVEYDIKGKKEQPYVVSKFRKALAAGDPKIATVIQNYIIEKVMFGRYTEDALLGVEIPEKQEFAHLAMNQVWYRSLKSGASLTAEDCGRITALGNISPSDIYISFNEMVCRVKNLPIRDYDQAAAMEKELEKFYQSDIDKKTVDGLHLEFRFRLIETFDSLEGGEAIVQESIERIKEVFDLKETTWQNALKLAGIFVDQRKSYEYAASLLDPFVEKGIADANLLQYYVSLCTYVPARMSSAKFSRALSALREQDREGYCKLFGEPHHSFQLLSNPFVKEEYCKHCR